MIHVSSRGIARIPRLGELLGEAWVHAPASGPPRGDKVAGWGMRPSADKARRFAHQHGLPFLALEDGFLRSIGLGYRAAPLSMVVDDLGIYYDATQPSRLESLVTRPRSIVEVTRGRALAAGWRNGRVSKYNHAREVLPPLLEPFVLVVDQTFDDASVRGGLADPGSFARMLQAALDEHPDLPVLMKVHPDVVNGRKRGYFGKLTPGQAGRVTLLAGDAHPSALLERVHAVYVVTSQMGFEALLWGKPVRSFGMPFYAGWGLTCDELAAPARRGPGGTVAFAALTHATLVDYARYIHPETGKRCEVERLIEWMALQRRMRERFPPQIHALAFSRWKKPIARVYLGGSEVTFVRRVAQVPAGATVAVWGKQTAGPKASSVLRLEDGFLRSVGLGADLVWPLSWVVDRRGIYYDATAPSDLEQLLSSTSVDNALITRARALREQICALGLTKYNVGEGHWQRAAGAQHVILVPGQVETDASITLGAPGLRSNLELLKAVRQAAPHAHIVYKPHPDVVARLRRKGRGEVQAKAYCDEIILDVPMAQLLSQVDEVHVLTSLAGFEALLRGRRVVTWGCPFYAGWGLTEDRLHIPRRTRRLTLDELVAATLILYPTYFSRRSGGFTTPENALRELQAWREQGASRPAVWQRVLRTVRRIVLRPWAHMTHR